MSKSHSLNHRSQGVNLADHEIRIAELSAAEKMAGEITLSDSPGKALKKWRMSFNIPQGVLSEHLEVSPSVISDYEAAGEISNCCCRQDRRHYSFSLTKQTAAGTSRNLQKCCTATSMKMSFTTFTTMRTLFLLILSRAIGCTTLCGSLDQSIFGYTVVNSLNAIFTLSSNQFNRIYGWSTERALIFTHVSTGKSPMVVLGLRPSNRVALCCRESTSQR